MHVGEDGSPLNSDSDILLEGVVRVGYARMFELRKLNGKKRVPRLGVRASSASVCSAVDGAAAGGDVASAMGG